MAITRRYYRSGESEYRINKTMVRLRDVHELFMDTGLGRDGYSIIGQGKIDGIVSAKSEDRRRSSKRPRASRASATARRRPNAVWTAPRKTSCACAISSRSWRAASGALREQAEKAEKIYRLRRGEKRTSRSASGSRR